jgi:hypothetical protein
LHTKYKSTSDFCYDLETVLDGFCYGSDFFLYKKDLCLRRSGSACRQWTKAWLRLRRLRRLLLLPLLLLLLHRPHPLALLPLLLLQLAASQHGFCWRVIQDQIRGQ